MTVGVVTVAVGKQYLDMLERWATSVASLERKPDSVTIATDEMPQEYIEIVNRILPEWKLVISEHPTETHCQIFEYFNDAIAVTDTDWICKLDVDDVIYPHALNALDYVKEDVYCFGIKIDDKSVSARPVTADEVLNLDENLIYSNSPFRRQLWTENHYSKVVHNDWVFWVGCAAQNATFAASPNIDYKYKQSQSSYDDEVGRAEVRAAKDECRAKFSKLLKLKDDKTK